MTVHRIGSLIGVFFALVCANEAVAKDWSGFSVHGGYAFGTSDFTVEHQSNDFSFGTLLVVPVDGQLTMVGALYRWRLAERLYVGAKVDFYNGDLTGGRTNEYYGLQSSFDFKTTLTGTVGGQFGYAFGTHERLLGYVGGGIAGSQATAEAVVSYQEYSVTETWDGGTIGPYLEIGGSYAFTEKISGFLEIKKFFYETTETCTFIENDCGRFTVSIKPVVITVGVEWTF